MKIQFNSFSSFYNNNREGVINEINNIFSSGQYLNGDNIITVEKRISEICKRKYAVTTNSCTDALFLALKSININEGDEVIIPTFSFIATLNPVLMCKATPVFADINPVNLMLDTKNIESLITKKTKAIIFVQLFGNCYDLTELTSICTKNSIHLIEDAAQALGADINHKPGGSFGTISCISFDPTKIVSAFSTGGVALTNDFKIYSTLKKLTHHGKNNKGDYQIVGYNSKLSELSAALINMQLNKLCATIKIRNEIALLYINRFKTISKIQTLVMEPISTSTFHKFVILAEDRDLLREYLLKNGIETQIHYKKLLNTSKAINHLNNKNTNYSTSNKISKMILSLPLHQDLKANEINYICDTISKFYKTLKP